MRRGSHPPLTSPQEPQTKPGSDCPTNYLTLQRPSTYPLLQGAFPDQTRLPWVSSALWGCSHPPFLAQFLFERVEGISRATIVDLDAHQVSVQWSPGPLCPPCSCGPLGVRLRPSGPLSWAYSLLHGVRGSPLSPLSTPHLQCPAPSDLLGTLPGVPPWMGRGVPWAPSGSLTTHVLSHGASIEQINRKVWRVPGCMCGRRGPPGPGLPGWPRAPTLQGCSGAAGQRARAGLHG